MSEILGLIPARGGSKSVPNKNIAPVAGRPLIAWTIAAAKASKCLSRLIVSTDSPTIAGIAQEEGVETPFLRPAELARDDTPAIDPVLHALRWLDEHEIYRPDYVMLLQPTSPLRVPEDIQAAVKLAEERRAEAVVSVCEAHQHPYWTKRLLQDGRVVDFVAVDVHYLRRQDLPPAYFVNGAIYLNRRTSLLAEHTFFPSNTYSLIMPPERSLQIDSAWDLRLVSLILS